ncbi:dephospho-CoA kinase family [Melia azedarach]|uniref:Dephospho-CoA kinase family n=1 Tax=Melia azedarach TaxID=155640 RepID=A0ACC1YX67_MELAZ|nr:dephospho-CoA kinase family [Melia azedarach]
MRIVGLTGGIASGKSTVSNLLKANDVPVVDADLVSRDVLKKGTGGWKKVVAAFGEDILLPNGEVDRAKLGQIVFSDSAKRQLLNRLLAPYISSGIFLEILKLWIKGCKLRRLMARDRTSEEDARNRINAQMPLDIKRNKADIVIDNTGSLDDLNEQFRKVLFEVTRPLTWTEFWLSRQGAVSALVSVIVGVLVCRKVL